MEKTKVDITPPPPPLTDILMKYVFKLRRTCPKIYGGKKFHQHTVTLRRLLRAKKPAQKPEQDTLEENIDLVPKKYFNEFK